MGPLDGVAEELIRWCGGGDIFACMKGSQPIGPLVLPVVRWSGLSSAEIRLRASASDCLVLSEADVVGEVAVEGKADIGPKEIVVDLQVKLSTREICGRSLEEFEHPMEFPVKLLLRRDTSVQGVLWEEDGEDVWEARIADDLRELDIEEVLRQAVELERPISPVKPGVPLPQGVLPEQDAPDRKPIDPRWAALGKLKDGSA